MWDVGKGHPPSLWKGQVSWDVESHRHRVDQYWMSLHLTCQQRQLWLELSTPYALVCIATLAAASAPNSAPNSDGSTLWKVYLWFKDRTNTGKWALSIFYVSQIIDPKWIRLLPFVTVDQLLQYHHAMNESGYKSGPNGWDWILCLWCDICRICSNDIAVAFTLPGRLRIEIHRDVWFGSRSELRRRLRSGQNTTTCFALIICMSRSRKLRSDGSQTKGERSSTSFESFFVALNPREASTGVCALSISQSFKRLSWKFWSDTMYRWGACTGSLVITKPAQSN